MNIYLRELKHLGLGVILVTGLYLVFFLTLPSLSTWSPWVVSFAPVLSILIFSFEEIISYPRREYFVSYIWEIPANYCYNWYTTEASKIDKKTFVTTRHRIQMKIIGWVDLISDNIGAIVAWLLFVLLFK